MTFEEITSSMDFEPKKYNPEHIKIIVDCCEKYWKTFNIDKTITYNERIKTFRELIISEVKKQINSTDDYSEILADIISRFEIGIKKS